MLNAGLEILMHHNAKFAPKAHEGFMLGYGKDSHTYRVFNTHYYRLLLTQHYNQRPFNETVCDALIANRDVKNHQKICKTFAMAET